jgi:prepilin-type N-terminal cleavage/methylation domain-containing protein
MDFKIHRKKLNRGFTIVEVAISIFVLSIAVIGVYSAFTLVALLTSDVEERFIGVYLAQEGVEIIRNIRDTNWVLDADNGWDEAISIYNDGGCMDNGCQVAYNSSPSPWAGGTYLNIDENGFYSYSGEMLTKFKRKIIIEDSGAGAIHVSVEVSWNKKATMLSPEELAGTADCSTSESNCVVFEEYMYDWY